MQTEARTSSYLNERRRVFKDSDGEADRRLGIRASTPSWHLNRPALWSIHALNSSYMFEASKRQGRCTCWFANYEGDVPCDAFHPL